LAELESVAGWKTARVKRPVQILGSLDGIETGVRQLMRDEPLETTQIEYLGEKLTVPTESEILRIKGVLILKRNATRDYLDFVALAEHMGNEKMVEALRPFDHLYPQPNEESALQGKKGDRFIFSCQAPFNNPIDFIDKSHSLFKPFAYLFRLDLHEIPVIALLSEFIHARE
ncbi:MAG: hypothetical protein NTV33_12020, partial [Coprothermobacterota bacterium]|nr:hypothetical protein [Coprothermobacterota bacterium]